MTELSKEWAKRLEGRAPHFVLLELAAILDAAAPLLDERRRAAVREGAREILRRLEQSPIAGECP